MHPRSNQPGHFLATVKFHKLESIADISLDNLKFCPIIDIYVHKEIPIFVKNQFSKSCY